MRGLRLKISMGNTKTGAIPALSHTPGRGCLPGVLCNVRGGCYALKAYTQHPGTRAAWDSNLDLWLEDKERYAEDLFKFLDKKRPRMFRYFVSGDIPDSRYLRMMIDIAEDFFSSIKFLCFTKRHDILCKVLPIATIPSNLSIVHSQWPGFFQPDFGLPRAWCHDGTETRVPEDALECFGNCETCGLCWNLKDIGRDVYFHKH